MAFYGKSSFLLGSIMCILLFLSILIGGSFMWTTTYASIWMFAIAIVWDLRHIWNNRRPSELEVQKMRELVMYMS